MRRYVLDSFAILAWENREPHGQRVRQLVRAEENRFWMSVVNAGEVYYRIAKDYDVPEAERVLTWLSKQPVALVDANRELTFAAARIKARYALSYADCFAAALAKRLSAQVITGDPEFAVLERDRIVEIAWL